MTCLQNYQEQLWFATFRRVHSNSKELSHLPWQNKKFLFRRLLVIPSQNRSSHRRCSVRKGVLRNFAKFTGEHLCQSLFLNKVTGLRPATLWKKRLWHMCSPVNFAKFLRKLIYRTPLVNCFCQKFSCEPNLFLTKCFISVAAALIVLHVRSFLITYYSGYKSVGSETIVLHNHMK